MHHGEQLCTFGCDVLMGNWLTQSAEKLKRCALSLRLLDGLNKPKFFLSTRMRICHSRRNVGPWQIRRTGWRLFPEFYSKQKQKKHVTSLQFWRRLSGSVRSLRASWCCWSWSLPWGSAAKTATRTTTKKSRCVHIWSSCRVRKSALIFCFWLHCNKNAPPSWSKSKFLLSLLTSVHFFSLLSKLGKEGVKCEWN